MITARKRRALSEKRGKRAHGRTRQLIRLLEHFDDASVVNPGGEDDEKVVEEHRLLGKVVGEGLVVDLNVGDLDHDLLELVVLPCVGGALHHGEGGVVELVVLDVEEDELRPEVSLLRGANDLGNVCGRGKRSVTRSEGAERRNVLMRDQKSLRCSIRRSGRYCESRMVSRQR